VTADRVGWLLRRWALVVALTTIVAAAVAFAWVGRGQALFVSEGTYVVGAHVANESELVRATATLTASDEITATFANIAGSELIADQARDRLSAAEGRAIDSSLEVISAVVADSNILKIGARAGDPHVAQAMATAVGEATQDFVREIDDLFVLTALDAPALPESSEGRPVGWIVLGAAMVGLLASTTVAVAVESELTLSSPRVRLRNIVDERSTAFNRRYMTLRFDEEISRCQTVDAKFSLIVMQIEMRHRRLSDEPLPATFSDDELRLIVGGLRQTLIEPEMLGYVGESRFVAILPNVELEQARSVAKAWKTATATVFQRDSLVHDVEFTVSACQYSPQPLGDPEARLSRGPQ
jgi:capsular polysaccharide biosynthesis protein